MERKGSRRMEKNWTMGNRKMKEEEDSEEEAGSSLACHLEKVNMECNIFFNGVDSQRYNAQAS